jgi:hypothetical protein
MWGGVSQENGQDTIGTPADTGAGACGGGWGGAVEASRALCCPSHGPS